MSSFADELKEHLRSPAARAREKQRRSRPCTCGHLNRHHTGNYNGSRACDHCSCPAFPLT